MLIFNYWVVIILGYVTYQLRVHIWSHTNKSLHLNKLFLTQLVKLDISKNIQLKNLDEKNKIQT